LPDVKLLDFGISKVLDPTRESARLTRTGVAVGTPSSMSPEQALGEKDLDWRADIYAAGVLLYRCLTGKLPFVADEDEGVLYKIVRGVFPPPRQIRPEIPEEYERLILKAMAWNREQRFASAAEMLLALMTFLDERAADRIVLPDGLPRRSGPPGAPAASRSSPPALVRSGPPMPIGAKERGKAWDGELATSQSPPPPALLGTPSGLGGTERGLGRPASTGRSPAPSSPGSSGRPSSLSRPSSGARPSSASAPGRPRQRAQREPGRGLVVAAALAALALVGVAIALVAVRPWERRDAGPSRTPAPHAALPASTAPAGPVAPPAAPAPATEDARPATSPAETVEVRVTIHPIEGRLWIDGVEVEGNPYVGTHPRDDREHLFEARAEGYERSAHSIRFDTNQIVSIQLTPASRRSRHERDERESTRGPGRPAPPAVAPAPRTVNQAPRPRLVQNPFDP
jgi:serine/threonine-protein kinase